MREYMKDQRFVKIINEVKSLGIHVNDSRLDALLFALNLYIDDEDPEIPLWLAIRELGGAWTDYNPSNPAFDFYSNDVATIVLEEYFQSYPEGAAHIFNELNRISRQKMEMVSFEETEFSKAGDEAVVRYRVVEKVHVQTFRDEYGDGSIHNFDVKDILKNIKPVMSENIIYYEEDSFTFINTDNTELIQKLSKDFKVKRV